MSTMAWKGAWSLVTGASSGLGEELAKQLAQRGASLELSARSVDKLEALAASLRASHGIEVRVVPADLSVPGEAAALLARIEALGVPIDHLVANAGVGAFDPFAEQTAEAQAEMIRLNCEALVILTHGLVPPMLERRRGGVMLVASTASFQPTPLFATYAATKAFVRSFGEALAEELRGSGVTINVLCPGPVHTGFQARAGSHIGGSQRSLVLDADETVRQGLVAYERGAVVFVPGTTNRVGATLASVLPNRLVVRAVARMMRDRGER